MNRQEIEKRVRAMYEGFASGDVHAYRKSFADHVAWHVPGNNPVSGPYRGADEYFGTMVERMMPLDEWRVTPTQVFTNDMANTALVAFHMTGLRRGKRVDMDGFHVVRLNSEGQVVEGWGFSTDQKALDEFFSA